MKKNNILFIILLILFTLPGFSQDKKEPKMLGLPGDDLDLQSVMDLFVNSKTIEDFEKALNEEKTGINNLDLNDDKKVDFIKVETKKEGENFKFVLQDPVSDTKTQEVAVIHLTKDKDQKVDLKIVGDKKLYGDNYVIKPRTKKTPGTTPNPAYAGADPVKEAVPETTTTVVVVETVPVVQYVYSPAYVPYYPPYYYGYYPPYYMPFVPVARAIYWDNQYDRYDDYWDDREDMYDNRQDNLDDRNENRNDQINTRGENTSDRQTKENASARQTAGTKESTRPTAGTKETARPSTTPSKGTTASTRPSTSPSKGSSSSARPSTSQSRGSYSSAQSRPSSSTRQTSPSRSYSSGASRSMSSGAASRGGGGMRGGGGGRRR